MQSLETTTPNPQPKHAFFLLHIKNKGHCKTSVRIYAGL